MYRLICSAALSFLLAVPFVARAAAERFVLDETHAAVLFAVNHFGYARVFGRFDKVTGEFTVDRENAANSQVEVKIEATSLNTGVADRDRHLRGPDFFNVGEHPAITFKSTGVQFVNGTDMKVSGDLTILGVTKPVTIDMKLNKVGPNFRKEMVAGVSGALKVKRSDFGMNYMAQGIGDEIEIWLEIEGKKKA